MNPQTQGNRVTAMPTIFWNQDRREVESTFAAQTSQPGHQKPETEPNAVTMHCSTQRRRGRCSFQLEVNACPRRQGCSLRVSSNCPHPARWESTSQPAGVIPWTLRGALQEGRPRGPSSACPVILDPRSPREPPGDPAGTVPWVSCVLPLAVIIRSSICSLGLSWLAIRSCTCSPAGLQAPATRQGLPAAGTDLPHSRLPPAPPPPI